ncbi:NtaA/DmoA family FMN-dependent monooxygenase [Arthrobacter gengyunqii]|uniref:NtaA/DmoA family FMN-dependent monooxygenase n=1 Tax=Arthrobacter gengyunqii TaxID=2886940 RepID=A0A9X1S5H7_9MICC|nr:NtaA/DmoA family FMN-dependent monooxygenase [Arthrobacter gengyunqii]MCC3267777.1 NtaA/DmoA family FMN-dependent monooxygenase [Arthrobacter gengyunqii]UOY95209.1 NtaA/DmoA family FMN-dependent monooxygenase [Arthrobacter gengyunqii]
MKQISLGVFEMLNPNNGLPTLSHPQNRTATWDNVDYWTSLATTLDDAGFDFLFFADTYGYPTIEGALPDAVVRHGIQFPGLDPMLMISALARATRRLGFVVTSPTTVERPYATARRFASLDQYTAGRIGWNIVTGSSQATTDALFGTGTEQSHDSRYDVADEFVDLCLNLWEGGWDDDAVERTSAAYANPAKVRPTVHAGTHFAASGTFAVAPTPQRTPVLFQAGTSARGRAFAARNAECVFIQGQSIAQAAKVVAEIRAEAVSAGRDPAAIKIISGATVTVAGTAEEAAERRAELEAQYSLEDAAVMFAGFTGVNLVGVDPALPLTEIGGLSSNQGQTLLDRYVRDGAPVPTVGEILGRFRLTALRGFQITGGPEQVADELEAIIAGTGLDGFMLEPTFGGPEAFTDFIALVLPLLRNRGLYPPLPVGGTDGEATTAPTLRERLTGGAARLPQTHPGSRFRGGPLASTSQSPSPAREA